MRLVDCELSLDEQRSVLRKLEAEPGGWRRCAVAFLEDQALQRQMCQRTSGSLNRPLSAVQPVLGQTPSERNAGPATVSSRRQKPTDDEYSWGKLFSLAVTILLAFSAGWWAESSRKIDSQIPSLVDAANPARIAQTGIASPPSPDVGQPERPYAGQYYAGQYYVDDSRVWDRESVIPSDVRRSLQRIGADVHHQRGLIPVTLSDGRRISVPYEDVQIVPVSNRSY